MINQVNEIARQLYFKLPFWKRWSFKKWYKSNEWDVKYIYSDCLEEAFFLRQEEIRFEDQKLTGSPPKEPS